MMFWEDKFRMSRAILKLSCLGEHCLATRLNGTISTVEDATERKINKIRSSLPVLYAGGTKKGRKKDVSLPLPNSYSPPFVEAAWYEWWEKEGFFRPEYGRDLSVPNPKGNFTVVMPPPNVTGSLHVGHALSTAVEDLMCRWYMATYGIRFLLFGIFRQRMKGKTVLYNPGCDHAGIATQVVVEKKILRERGLSRHDLGREKFVEEVWKWKDEKQHTLYEQIKKLGASVDWRRHVFSMDPKVARAVTEAFILMHEKGLIHRSNRLVNWSCTLRSAISDIEVENKMLTERTYLKVPGYEEKVKFGVLVFFSYLVENSEEEVTVSTTRIETMLGDVAIAVHPDDDRYHHLIGKKCKHPFLGRSLLIIADSFVDMGFGTGAVKITPSHDHVDYEVAVRHNLPFINILTDDGYLLNNCGQFSGMKRFDARMKVLEALKYKGLFRGVADHPMALPVCSRSSDIIEPMVKSQWFVKCSVMCQKAMEVIENGDLKIIPDIHHKGLMRYLEDSRDWCISRQLWWGHRIPAYFISIDDPTITKGDFNDDRYWVAAYNEEEAICKAAAKFNVESSKVTVKQDEDVLDTWFSSGLWPFAVMGWPEQTKDLERFFPGHLLETGHDILFFWVARMVFLSQELCGKLPFNEVFLHPVVRDSYGKKMSKSLGNVTDPLDIIHGITLDEMIRKLEEGDLDPKELSIAKAGMKKNFKLGIPESGADALRFALLAYQSDGRDINLDIIRLLGYRSFCNKIWQGYKFVILNLPSFFPLEDKYRLTGNEDKSDRWILSQLSFCVQKCNEDLEIYRFSSAAASIYNFWHNQFCDIYVECVKSYLRGDDAVRKNTKQQILYLCVETFLRLISPFMPFLSEELWQRLAKRGSEKSASVCVAEYPESKDYPFYDETLYTPVPPTACKRKKKKSDIC